MSPPSSFTKTQPCHSPIWTGTRPLAFRSKLATPANSRCEDQLAFEVVSPAMVRAAEIFGFAFAFSYDSRSVVAANVVEAAQNAVVASDDEN